MTPHLTPHFPHLDNPVLKKKKHQHMTLRKVKMQSRYLKANPESYSRCRRRGGMCHVEEGEEKGRVSVEACHAGVQGMGGGGGSSMCSSIAFVYS